MLSKEKIVLEGVQQFFWGGEFKFKKKMDLALTKKNCCKKNYLRGGPIFFFLASKKPFLCS